MGIKSPVKCAGYRVGDSEEIKFGNIKIDVIDTPGHTKDSISLVCNNIILTGDALFLDDGGAGRDDLPGGDPSEHWESLQKFRKQKGDLIVHPAHDYRNREPSSLSNQIKTNPHFKPESKNVKVLKDGMIGWNKV